MNAVTGRLKATLLVIGVLVVGLGLYAVFQVDEVEAHSPFTCTIMPHAADFWNPYHSTTTTNLRQRSITGTCSVCGGSATLTSWRQRIEVKTERKYNHFWGVWVYCHSHTTVKVSYQWSPPSAQCHDPDCGG